VTLNLDFKVMVALVGEIFMPLPIDALSVLCAQLTHDLFAIAKFLFYSHCIATTALFVSFLR